MKLPFTRTVDINCILCTLNTYLDVVYLDFPVIYAS